jgi:general secretion pathway protein H
VTGVGEKRLGSGLSSIRALFTLTVGAIVAAFTVPIYTKAVGQALHDECAQQIVAALEQTRRAATVGRKTASFQLDIDAERYNAAGEIGPLILPGDARVTITPARQVDAGMPPNGILFFADGSSSGGEIRIAYQDLVHVIDIDGSTGRVLLR